MKTIIAASAIIAAFAIAPAQAMSPITTTKAIASEASIHEIGTRVTKKRSVSAGSSSSLLNSGLGLNLGNLLGVDLGLGILQSNSYAQQKSFTNIQKNSSKRHR